MASLIDDFADHAPNGKFFQGLGWLGVAVVCAAGISWRMAVVQYGPEQACQNFLTALLADDTATIRRLLAPELRDRATELQPGWSAKSTARIPIHFKTKLLKEADRNAEVAATISRQGFSIKPHLWLERQADGRWLIAEIDQLVIDPRWEKALDDQHHEDDEALAKELAKALHLP